MPVPDHLRDRYAYHFTTIDNLPTILELGLLATNEKRRINLLHRPIAAQNIQARRSTMNVTCYPGGVVHDYVPFYFCKRSPMLRRVLQNGWADQWNIVYITIPITIIERTVCVFTDASANTSRPPNFFNNPTDLVKINWEAVDTWKWGRQHDIPGQIPKVQAKQAELLVHKRVRCEFFTKIVVWSEQQQTKVRQMYRRLSITPPDIEFGRYDFYFLNEDGTSAIQRSRTSFSDDLPTLQSNGPEYPYTDSDFASLIQTYESEIHSDQQLQEGADDQYYW